MSKELTIIEDKNKGGRPPIIFTPEDITDVEKLAGYLTCEQIADYFGISHTAFQDVRARQEEVLLAYKKGRAKKIYRYVKQLEDKAMGINLVGDTTAIIFYLKTQGGASWKQNKVEEEIKDNKLEITVSIAENQNKENLARFKEMCNQDTREKEAKLKELK